MKTFKAMQVTEPGKMELVERPVPVPGYGEVLLKVEACGICGADAGVVEGLEKIRLIRVSLDTKWWVESFHWGRAFHHIFLQDNGWGSVASGDTATSANSAARDIIICALTSPSLAAHGMVAMQK